MGLEGTGGSVIPSPETFPSPSVTQPKRTFTTVRTPKDIASENSISRCVATPGPLSSGMFRERQPQSRWTWVWSSGWGWKKRLGKFVTSQLTQKQSSGSEAPH